MATVQHSALTSSNLHEPKGADTATANQVYISDGAGSGAWTNWPLGFGFYEQSGAGQVFNVTPAKVTINGSGAQTNETYLPQAIRELEKKAEELSKQDYAKELLAQLQAQTPKDKGMQEAPRQSEVQQEAEQTTPTPDDIKSLIEKTLTQRERENTAKQNLTLVEQHLTEAFGTEADATVKRKAKELGMSLGKLEELASESPSAFMALMGSPRPKETNTLPKGQTNTESMKFNNPSGERNWAYYNKLRKENPKLYRSAQVQQQMMQDRVKLGSRFNT